MSFNGKSQETMISQNKETYIYLLFNYYLCLYLQNKRINSEQRKNIIY